MTPSAVRAYASVCDMRPTLHGMDALSTWEAYSLHALRSRALVEDAARAQLPAVAADYAEQACSDIGQAAAARARFLRAAP